jgi:hypothetical protein
VTTERKCGVGIHRIPDLGFSPSPASVEAAARDGKRSTATTKLELVVGG